MKRQITTMSIALALLLSVALGSASFHVNAKATPMAPPAPAPPDTLMSGSPATGGCETPSFAGTTNFDTGNGPVSVATGDFNGDGKLDLATANGSSATVSVLLGNGTGGFAPATSFGVGSGPRSVTTGDFNLDGKLDLATANQVSNNVSVLLGSGTGGFAPATNFPAGSTPFSVTTGDFNLDGKLDLATANGPSAAVSVLLGNGTGGFAPATSFGVGSGARSVTTGDFNGDGKLDLATANRISNNVSILLGNGTGGFAPATNFPADIEPLSVTTGDFNGDGKLDLATANRVSNNVSILLGNGTGGFAPATNFPAGTAPVSVTTGDFNPDGKLDLATANVGGVSMLLGNGRGRFAPATNFPAGSEPVSVTTGDFNLDGRLDLAAANQFSNNVSVMLNTCDAFPCGGSNFAPATSFGLDNTPASVTTGDFNLDGKLDLATANFVSDNVSVLLGNGTGGFAPATSFPVGLAPFSLTTGDFNGDGKLDLATANRDNSNVSVLLGNGAGGFAPSTTFGVGSEPVSVTTGDFNMDGKLDLATANQSYASVSILLGNGTGGFAPATFFQVGTHPQSITTGDFNADGKLDLATASSSTFPDDPTPRLSDVSVLLGNGAGGFAASFGGGGSTGGGVGSSVSVTTGDFNLDGKLDLATANQSYANVLVLFGDGAGGVELAMSFDAGMPVVYLTTGDFNGDCRPDLAVASPSSANISVLLGNGAGGFAPATSFGVGNDPASVTTGDFNADGKLDLATAGINHLFSTNNVSVLLNNCPNTAPAAVIDDSYNTEQDITLNVDAPGVLANDTYEHLNPVLSTTIISPPGHAASFTLHADGSFSYHPLANFYGSDSFTYRVSDPCLMLDTATVTITVDPVNDTPTITAASGLTRQQAAGAATSSIATVNDVQDAETTLSVTINSSSGATVNGVTFSGLAVDAAGNVTAIVEAACGATNADFTLCVTDSGNLMATVTLNVTVTNESTPPVLNNCPADITANAAAGQCAANVTYTPPTATDNCSGVDSVSCTPPSGTIFPKGTTSVTCTVKDAANNQANCSFTVTVNDTQPPSITCPANITVPSDQGQSSAVVTYAAPSVSDNCPGVGTPVCVPPSGSSFATGTTLVNCTVTDAHGNSNACSFSITVTVTVIGPQLTALSPGMVWIGLKNSDDVGTRFDLLAEVLKNGSVIGTGQLNNVAGGSSGFNNAVLRTINLGLSAGAVGFSPGDTLSFRLSVRIAATSGHVSGTARLWYNGASIDSGPTRDAGSRFGATITGASDYFLRSGSLLNTSAGASKLSVDVTVNGNVGGNPFVPFGTWTRTF